MTRAHALRELYALRARIAALIMKLNASGELEDPEFAGRGEAPCRLCGTAILEGDPIYRADGAAHSWCRLPEEAQRGA